MFITQNKNKQILFNTQNKILTYLFCMLNIKLPQFGIRNTKTA